MSRIRPVVFIWSADGHMVPMGRFRRQCDEQFVVGQEYPLTILEARSRASHSHYWACIHEAWKNLPEDLTKMDEFQTAEHLRAWALIKTGWFDLKTFDCASEDHAMHLAAHLKSKSPYSIIVWRGQVVREYEPKSQSAAAMGREEFQKSKTDVLEKIADLIGVTTGQLRREGARTFPEPKRIA